MSVVGQCCFRGIHLRFAVISENIIKIYVNSERIHESRKSLNGLTVSLARVVQRPLFTYILQLLHKLYTGSMLLQTLKEEMRLTHDEHQTLPPRSG